MPKTAEHKAASRNAILKAAYHRFSHQGFRHTRIDDVMADAGLTRGAFYNHFKTKADLYQEAFRFAREAQTFLVPKEKSQSTKEWLTQLVDRYLSTDHLSPKKLGCPLAYLNHDRSADDPSVRALYQRTFLQLNQYLQQHTSLSDRAGSFLVLLIGTISLARDIDDHAVQISLLKSAHRQAMDMVSSAT